MNHYEIWHEVAARIQVPIVACAFISELMQHCRNKTFNGLMRADFTNSTDEIRAAVAVFCAECNKTFNLQAIYLEMNGFDINPARWYFDLFGYQSLPESNQSLDWLCDWQSPHYPSITLMGLESIQSLYQECEENPLQWNLDTQDKDLAYNRELATLLVMAKFCKLIDESLGDRSLGIDVWATAHDFDIIYHKPA